MSHWRQAVCILYELGGTAPTGDLALSGANLRNGLREARGFGLVDCSSGIRKRDCVWWLTETGIAYAEGRVIPWRGAHPTDREPAGVTKRGRGYAHVKTRFIATWLSALPRDIRITQQEPA